MRSADCIVERWLDISVGLQIFHRMLASATILVFSLRNGVA